MRRCPKCNSVIENDKAKFCKKCGTKLEMIPESVQPEPIHKPEPAYSPNVTAAPVDSEIPLNGTGSSYNSCPMSEGIVLGGGQSQPTTETTSYVPPRPSSESMNMSRAIKTCFSKYAKFEGKAKRSEYWYFWLFNFLLEVIPVILALAIDKDIPSLPLVGFAFIYCLVSCLPMLAVTVRRLHDVGKSGYFFFIAFIPYIGGFILLYFLCKKSK